MSHGHDHADHHGGPTPERALWVAVILNASFLILEAAIGFWTNSLALLSDAGHMVSDVGALLVALFAVKIASSKPSEGYTFGLRRAPVLGGLINVISLVIIVVLIGIEAVERFQYLPEVDAMAVLATGIAGLAVNLGSAWYLARSRDESVNTRGAMLHLLSDALGSVAAIVSAVAVAIFGAKLADPIASLIIGFLILVGSWPLLRDTVRILMQRAPGGLDVDAAKSVILDHPSVESLCDFHVWALDGGQPILSAVFTVNVDRLMDATRVADELREMLKDHFHIEHSTFEPRHRSANTVDLDC